MNFDDLQRTWHAESSEDISEVKDLKKSFENKWRKNQQKSLWMNVGLTLGFSFALIGIGLVYFAYRHQYGWPFKVSIILAYLLMAIYLLISWQSYGFKKENLELQSKDYVAYQLKKLKWQRKILSFYSSIYTILMWLTLIMYSLEVAARGNLLFKLGMIAIITFSTLGVATWKRNTTQKKKVAELDQLISNLKELQSINR